MLGSDRTPEPTNRRITQIDAVPPYRIGDTPRGVADFTGLRLVHRTVGVVLRLRNQAGADGVELDIADAGAEIASALDERHPSRAPSRGETACRSSLT